MNPVLILSYNNLPALQKCIESVWAQDIQISIGVVDNASSDGTREWLSRQDDIQTVLMDSNVGVSKGWNVGLKLALTAHEHCLVLNQDTILPAYAYRELLAFNVPLVTCRPVESMDEIGPETATQGAEESRRAAGLEPHPCFSAFLISRSCWETVGEFDESFFAWCSDCDYHVRGHLLGVGMWKSKVPFLHHAGTTLRTAPPDMRPWFHKKSDADRAAFKEKWGCAPEEPVYSNLFLPELFGVKKSG